MRASSVNTVILETLETSQAHLTAAQIFDSISQRLPAVNPSTVYRSLERLAHEGLVSVSDMGHGALVYEKVGGERHNHLVCLDCGQELTISDNAVHALYQQLEFENHFRLVTNHLVLFGHCQMCQSK